MQCIKITNILEVNADIDIGRVTINKGYYTLMYSVAIHNSLKLHALPHADSYTKKRY